MIFVPSPGHQHIPMAQIPLRPSTYAVYPYVVAEFHTGFETDLQLFNTPSNKKLQRNLTLFISCVKQKVIFKKQFLFLIYSAGCIIKKLYNTHFSISCSRKAHSFLSCSSIIFLLLSRFSTSLSGGKVASLCIINKNCQQLFLLLERMAQFILEMDHLSGMSLGKTVACHMVHLYINMDKQIDHLS